jgi:hypothetical protein
MADPTDGVAVEIEAAVDPGPAETAAETTAEIEAARAAASADAAREAAALAITQAEAATADVAAIAADELESYQARLLTCEASQTATRSLVESFQTETAVRLQEIEARQRSILERLEPTPEPPHESPPEEPPSEPREERAPEAVEEARAALPEEPRPPERRRAHRWI